MIDNIAPNSWKINIATYNTSIWFVRKPWNYNKNIAPEHRARQRSWKQLEHFWMYESAKWTKTRQILRSNLLNYISNGHGSSIAKTSQIEKTCISPNLPNFPKHHHIISIFLGGSAINRNRCLCEKAWFQDLLEFSETFQSIEAILLGWHRVFNHLRSDVKLDGWMAKSILIGSMYGICVIFCYYMYRTYTFGWILRVYVGKYTIVPWILQNWDVSLQWSCTYYGNSRILQDSRLFLKTIFGIPPLQMLREVHPNISFASNPIFFACLLGYRIASYMGIVIIQWDVTVTTFFRCQSVKLLEQKGLDWTP